MNKELDDIYEAQELWKEMQRDLDPDEKTDFWGRSRCLRGRNPDDEEEL